MDFNEKLQNLRKQKGLTQEELAEVLYVSRTAVSKWESGRGLPSIDSLKCIAKYFSVSLDELLSGDDILAIAETDVKQKQNRTKKLLFGLTDLGMALLYFLPFFAERSDKAVLSVPLISLSGVATYILAIYYVVISLTALCGVGALAFQNCKLVLFNRITDIVSLLLGVIATYLFIISLQPYAAIYSFFLIIIKVFALFKAK